MKHPFSFWSAKRTKDVPSSEKGRRTRGTLSFEADVVEEVEVRVSARRHDRTVAAADDPMASFFGVGSLLKIDLDLLQRSRSEVFRLENC